MTNQKKKEVSIASIQVAIQSLIKQGLKPSQRNVANETGLSIITIKRHWSAINEPIAGVSSSNGVSPQRVSPATNTSFNRLKQRKDIGEQPKSILDTIPALQKILDKL